LIFVKISQRCESTHSKASELVIFGEELAQMGTHHTVQIATTALLQGVTLLLVTAFDTTSWTQTLIPVANLIRSEMI